MSILVLKYDQKVQKQIQRRQNKIALFVKEGKRKVPDRDQSPPLDLEEGPAWKF